MKKTIEFVERKIKDKKDQLKRLENLKTMSNKYELQINELLTKNTEEDIENLEQIKAELEAWEVVKSATKRKLKVTGKYRDKFIEINHREYVEGTKKYQTLKKALEVEDDLQK